MIYSKDVVEIISSIVQIPEGRSVASQNEIPGKVRRQKKKDRNLLPQYYSADILSVNSFGDFPYEKPKNIAQIFIAEYNTGF